MKALVSYHKGFITFVRVMPARWEGENLLKVGEKVYRVRDMSFSEYLLSCVLWFVPLLGVFYFYLFPYALSGKALGVFFVLFPMVLFFLFALYPLPFLGVVIFLVPVFLLLKPYLVFDYVAGMVAGYAVYLLYLFGERGYKTESGEVIALW